MKKVDVTSCNHSQGAPIVRVTMSKVTVVEKPSRHSPQSTIKIVSRTSKQRHFKWRCRCSTSLLVMCWPRFGEEMLRKNPLPKTKGKSFHIRDKLLDFRRMRAELFGKFVEIG